MDHLCLRKYRDWVNKTKQCPGCEDRNICQDLAHEYCGTICTDRCACPETLADWLLSNCIARYL